MAENSKEPCWYVVHTYSGYENKVKVNLEKAVENNGMQDLITEVTIPTEEVVEIKNNKRKVVQRKLLPGYGYTARRHGAHPERPVRELLRPRGLDQRADADRQRHGADVQAGDAGRARFRRGRARGVRRLCPGLHARGAQC